MKQKIEPKLKTLKSINIKISDKKKIRKEAREWKKFIKKHMKEIKHYPDNNYHQGEINFLDLFFNIKQNKKAIILWELK